MVQVARIDPGAVVEQVLGNLDRGGEMKRRLAIAAAGMDELGRRLNPEEYEMVADHLVEIGLEDGFIQELSSSDEKYIPKFDLTGV